MKNIKTFETFERSEREELILKMEHKEKLKKIDFDALSKKYKNHFFLNDVYMKEYDREKRDFYIVLISKIEPHNSPYPLNNLYWPFGDSFTVYKNGEIKDPGGYGLSYTEDDFNKIHFMSAIEFYNEHRELCEKLFLKIINDLKTTNWADWYLKTLKWYRDVLETIPELQYIKNSEKYNL